MHQLSDDTNLLKFNSCIKSINKQVKYDLKNLANWSKSKKNFLDLDKTEPVLFTSPKKQLDCDLKIKLYSKNLYETDSDISRYLEIQIDKRLSWKQQQK